MNFFCFGFILGGLGILFACLSKTEPKMHTNAKIGIITSIIGILISVGIICLFVHFVSRGIFNSNWFRNPNQFFGPFRNFHY